MTDIEIEALEALRAWWLANRNRALTPEIHAYYVEPETRRLVEAAADLVTRS